MKVHIATYYKWMNFDSCLIVVGMKIFDLALLTALRSKFSYGQKSINILSQIFFTNIMLL